MISTSQEGKSIIAGYVWNERVELVVPTGDPVPFPAGCALTAHVRACVDDSTVLATLSTANGGIVRVNDTQIDLIITGSDSESWWEHGSVTLDVVRTDLAPDEHLRFILEIPVVRPVTRDLS